MSQTNIVFHCWFEDGNEKYGPLSGLQKFSGDFESGLAHFKDLGTPLFIDENHYEFKWVYSGILSTINYLSFELSCPHSETPFVKDLIKQLSFLSVKYMLLDVHFSGADGDISFGIYKGSQVDIKELIAVSSEDAPIFALIVNVLKQDYFSAEIVKKVVSKGINTIFHIKSGTEESKPIVFYFIEESRPIEMLDVFLKSGGYPEGMYLDEELNSIHYAVRISDIHNQEAMMDKINLLIKHKCNIDEVTTDKKTPLMYAIEQGRNKLAEFLIASGANLNRKNIDGLTALDLAEKLNNQDIIKVIKNAKAKALKKPKTQLDKLTDKCISLIDECNLAGKDFEKIRIVLNNSDIFGIYIDSESLMSPKIREDIQSKIKKELPELASFENPDNGLYELFRALLERLTNKKTVWDIDKKESHLGAFLNLIGIEYLQI
jgi:hypothetical protein